MDELNTDSAYTLLVAAVNRSSTPAERLRAFTLLGIVELFRNNQPGARQAFQNALRVDPKTRIDSLKDLHSDALLVFAQAKTVVDAELPAAGEAVPARTVLVVTPTLPADTMLSFDDARFAFAVQTNAPSRVFASIVSADSAAQLIWKDSQVVAGAALAMYWPVRPDGGDVTAPGRYVLRIQATDSTGQATPIAEHRLVIARVPVDTQAHPAALTHESFVPETLTVKERAMKVLLSGSSLAAAVIATPLLLGNPTLNQGVGGDATGYAVAGGIAVASLARFFKTTERARVSPENVRKNQQVREADRLQRENIARTNALARTRAPIRVTLERSP